jgi:hypothetical protein
LYAILTPSLMITVVPLTYSGAFSFVNPVILKITPEDLIVWVKLVASSDVLAL